MNFIDEFRDKESILALKKLIEQELKNPINIMEICGG
ncbi:hydrogenase formation protein HypD, partial [Campylobacter coli]|nr:hydrogenase formation protein HypD [Campylobacter coli]